MVSKSSIEFKITAGQGVQPEEYGLSFDGIEFQLFPALKGAKRLQAKYSMFGIQEPEARIQKKNEQYKCHQMKGCYSDYWILNSEFLYFFILRTYPPLADRTPCPNKEIVPEGRF